jgi:hypothetical protein
VLLPLKLDYRTLPKDADEVQTTVALLRHAVNSKYPQGVPRSETRLWAKIEDALDDRTSVSVDLTLDQFKFLREAVIAAQWPAPWSRLAVVLLDSMDELERSL